jgi:AmmeMemoRadiSam system protein A
MSSLPENQFSAADRRAMLALARAAIVSALDDKPLSRTASEPSCFSVSQGVFVTLEVFGKLRGCIGVIEPSEPLRESIIHCAQSAAFRDPRFPPLRREEVYGLKIEISVLSELFLIALQQIQIGKHGLLIATENHHGLLLPQVATEHKLSREEFLEETCCKAGLPRDAWRAPQTKVYAFTCETFREDVGPVSG